MVHLACGRGLLVDHPAPATDGTVSDTGDIAVEDVHEQVLAGWLAGVQLICTDASVHRHPQTCNGWPC